MKVFIVGGTGFLGYYALLEFLRRGHEVTTMSIPDVKLGSWFPENQVKVLYGDVFAMSEPELIKTFEGYDGLVYAVGPDDRFIPKAPSYKFFHERLVEACGKVIAGARKAGIKTCAVCNSYFAYFDRMWPKAKLAERHPYIKCRVEQAERCFQEAGETMKMAILELPYIFGLMPERVPLWKDVLFERLKKMNPIMYTTGGTTMITVEHVGEAIVGAIENRAHGRFPVGDQNVSWKDMLKIMTKALGLNRKILILPKFMTFLAALYGRKLKNDDKKKGLQGGLDHEKLFYDIQSQFMYLDPAESVKALGYKQGGIEESITQTVFRCYPELAKQKTL